MSQLKSLTREVVIRGEERRGTYQAQGWPRRVYEWWNRHTDHPVSRESLCHYFWVVVLWAPLLRLRQLLAPVLRHTALWAVLVSAALVALVVMSVVFQNFVPLLPPGVAYCIWGVATGYTIGEGVFGLEKGIAVPWWFWPLAVVTLPAVLIGFTFFAVRRGLASWPARIAFRWCRETRLVGRYVAPWHIGLALGLGAVVAWSVLDGWWWALGLGVATIAGFAGAIALLYWTVSKVGSSIERQRDATLGQRRELQRQAREASIDRALARLDPIFRHIFAYVKSDERNDEWSYGQWRTRYVRHLEWYSSGRVVWLNILSHDSLVDLMWSLQGYHWSESFQNEVSRMVQMQSQRAQPAIVRQLAPVAVATDVVGAKLQAVATTLGDALVLIAQIIRVNKWKICPIVEFSEEV